MKYYKLMTVFDFGKHKGKTLKHVFKIDPSYVDWCLRIVNFFVIEQNSFNQLQDINTKWKVSKDARKSIVSIKSDANSCSSQYSYRSDDIRIYNKQRIAQHPELQGRPEHEAIELIELADDIGCRPEDLTANLDM